MRGFLLYKIKLLKNYKKPIVYLRTIDDEFFRFVIFIYESK